MGRTKVSSKYQIVIPKDVRQAAGIRVGQEFQVIAKGGQLTLVPDKPIASMRCGTRSSRAPSRLLGCTELVDERLHPLKGEETVLVRFPEILANQRPVDVRFVTLDHRVGARVDLKNLGGQHTHILVERSPWVPFLSPMKSISPLGPIRPIGPIAR
jgi:AbrB family looped-hinge helix DNA binding protein